MPIENSAVANSIAAAGKRLESMSLLCEMLAGQLERERRQYQEIEAALGSHGNEARSQVAPGDIAPEMLAG
jgi:hypothetical protein